MIPRTKVNYGMRQLVQAAFVGNRDRRHSEQLSQLLQRYFGEARILLTPSGRGGLYFILKATARPRVIVPAYTCNAVIEAAKLARKEISYVEAEDHGFNMSMAALHQVLGPDAVVIATHQFGIPCRIEETVKACRNAGAMVVEDVAAAMGTRIEGRLAGTFGDASFFSFDSTKLISVPLKGGFVLARDDLLFAGIQAEYRRAIQRMPLFLKWKLLSQAAILVCLQNHLLYRLFHWLRFGLTGQVTAETAIVSQVLTEFYKYDMAHWQAGIAAPQVEKIDELIALRQSKYAEYLQRLGDCRSFGLPPEDAGAEWACIRFPIRVRRDKFDFYRKLARRGVDCAFSFSFIMCPETFEKATLLAKQVLDLPFYDRLSAQELDRVVSVINAVDREE
jgi:dTDP-4-amino-4,6-dideoxygalactose transaminase